MNEPQADYDNPWKEALEQYFEAFLALFFPDAHAVIDWNRPTESLDKELQQIVPEAEVGKRLADKLFKVWQLGGEEAWVLVHIEVQSQEESDFAERMYIYHYRCFDRYRKPVISLAVLGDERASWRPSFYGYALGGCELSLRFPVAKLLDYETEWQSLEESTNPFAVMVMAHLKTKATRGVPQERKQWKWSLVRRLFERGYSREDIVRLFRLIDTMMVLPEELQREFKEELSRYQEDSQMPLLSRIELDAKQEGILETRRDDVITILEVRFGEVLPELREVINTLQDVSVLTQLLKQAIAILSIEEFQQLLEQHLAAETE
ncbi:transposase [Allocoleopsis sp.]|uniref:transposase n=1 Tax=Allocoleopsis sp. TaxID=3088169 RepID=UPI002FD27A0E